MPNKFSQASIELGLGGVCPQIGGLCRTSNMNIVSCFLKDSKAVG